MKIKTVYYYEKNIECSVDYYSTLAMILIGNITHDLGIRYWYTFQIIFYSLKTVPESQDATCAHETPPYFILYDSYATATWFAYLHVRTSYSWSYDRFTHASTFSRSLFYPCIQFQFGRWLSKRHSQNDTKNRYHRLLMFYRYGPSHSSLPVHCELYEKLSSATPFSFNKHLI